MGRGGGRGPKPLHFRALVEVIAEAVDQMPEFRHPLYTRYSLRDCYLSSFALFFLQDRSLLEFQRRLEQQQQRNNLAMVFGVEQIPSDSRLREVVDHLAWQPLGGVFREWIRRAQRSKILERFRYLDGRYVVSMDGSQYFHSESVSCGRCLHRDHGDGRREYYHQVLQAAIVRPGMRQVLPMGPEFIRARDGQRKQDCEINAGKRLIKRIRQEYRQLPMIIVGDGLYSKAPFIRLLKAQRYSYLLVAKPADHRSLFENIGGMERAGMLDRLSRAGAKGKRYEYSWVNEVELGADPNSPVVTFVQLEIFDAKGKRSYRSSWVTDLAVNKENVEEVVRAARARWKIENEAFNTLKNHGYHLEHNFGHGQKYLSEAFFVLNLLAFMMHQLQELIDEVYREARGKFSARVEFWNTIRAMFRLLLFDSWDQLIRTAAGRCPPSPP